MDNKGPVFIVGMNGSGTTMLLDCLDNHPDLYGFRRETKILPYFFSARHKYGDLSFDENFLRLWDDIRQVPLFRQCNNGDIPPLPDNWRELPRTLASIVESIFSFFANKEGKQRWCEKTPMHALHIDTLARMFPNAHFVHIIRDGRASAASFYRRWGYKPELTMYRWKNVVQEARRQGAKIGSRYLEVAYETLTLDPKTQMQQICAFLLVEYNDRVLSTSRQRSFTGSSESNIVANVDKWRNYFDRERINRLEQIAGKTLAEFGYDTDCPSADHNPSKLELKLWMYKDYTRSGVSLLKKEWSERGDANWEDFSAKIVNAVRQRMTTRY